MCLVSNSIDHCRVLDLALGEYQVKLFQTDLTWENSAVISSPSLSSFPLQRPKNWSAEKPRLVGARGKNHPGSDVAPLASEQVGGICGSHSHYYS